MLDTISWAYPKVPSRTLKRRHPGPEGSTRPLQRRADGDRLDGALEFGPRLAVGADLDGAERPPSHLVGRLDDVLEGRVGPGVDGGGELDGGPDALWVRLDVALEEGPAVGQSVADPDGRGVAGPVAGREVDDDSGGRPGRAGLV